MHLCTLLLIQRGPLLYHFSLLLGPCGYQRCNGRNQQNLKSTYSLRILIQHWHCMNSLAVMIASRCSRYICLSANFGVSSPAVTYSTVTCGVPGSSSGTDHAFYHREYPISRYEQLTSIDIKFILCTRYSSLIRLQEKCRVLAKAQAANFHTPNFVIFPLPSEIESIRIFVQDQSLARPVDALSSAALQLHLDV